MPEPADLRALLLGYGFAGGWIHDPLLRATPGLAVAGIVTRDPDRRALAGSRNPGARLFETAEAAFAHGGFDLAVIAVPNSSHLELTLQALDHGLPVVVDKPLATTLEDGQRILQAAEQAGVVVSVFHNRRWDGDFGTVRGLVDDGALGEVHRFTSRFDRWAPGPTGWRDEAAGTGGGLLLDLGSHLVDQALELFGPVRRVYAELDTRANGRASEDDVFLALEHVCGVRSHLSASASQAEPGLRFHVTGDRAVYVKRGKDVQEERLLADELPEPGVSGAEPRQRWGRLHNGVAAEPVETTVGDWTGFYRDLLAHLKGDGPNPVPVTDALAVLAVLDAARRSATDGTAVEPVTATASDRMAGGVW
ncbi:Gfo/Idh/MocA family oxidoreductase [Pseudonocardia nantongensis]|uniref:Gfo/Idh/MocA family protein n=1 Tax=Pseudonocardia nantongensis TaxID=1181885 RepID=UPI003978C970